jgi:hypothetical protein
LNPALPGFLCQGYVAVHYTPDLLLSQCSAFKLKSTHKQRIMKDKRNIRDVRVTNMGA